MAAREGGGSRLDQARDQARGVIGGLRPGDQLTIITAGPQPAVLAQGGAGDSALLQAALDRITPAGIGADFPAALALAQATLDPGPTRTIIAITDGALPPVMPDQIALPLQWRTVGSDQPNRAIITFSARPWAGKLQIYARIANYSQESHSTTLYLYADGAQLRPEIIPLDPNGEYELTWSLPSGVSELRAELDSNDALPQDDTAYLSVGSVRPVRALLVSASPQAILRALAVVPGVTVDTVDPSAYTPERTRAIDLTILDGYLPEAWPASATLAINPPAGSTLITVTEQVATLQSDSLIKRNELLDGLSFSSVNFGEVRPIEQPAWASTLLSSQGQVLDDQGNITNTETPLIIRGTVDGRPLAVWGFDLAGGNLPARLAFPLLVSRTIRDLTASPPPASIIAGEPLALRPDQRADLVEITAPDGTTDLLASAAARAIEGLAQPGFYTIEERNGEQVLYRAQVGVNAGSPSESRLTTHDPPEITGADADPGAAGPLSQPVDLWPWFAALGLLILGVEWIYVLRR
jgi:Ca-activated chloride channel homolog